MMKVACKPVALGGSLAGVADLKGIREDGKDILIGAMTTPASGHRLRPADQENSDTEEKAGP
jgi:hypothetical protein